MECLKLPQTYVRCLWPKEMRLQLRPGPCLNSYCSGFGWIIIPEAAPCKVGVASGSSVRPSPPKPPGSCGECGACFRPSHKTSGQRPVQSYQYARPCKFCRGFTEVRSKSRQKLKPLPQICLPACARQLPASSRNPITRKEPRLTRLRSLGSQRKPKMDINRPCDSPLQ